MGSSVVRRNVIPDDIADSIFEFVLPDDANDYFALMLTCMLAVDPSEGQKLVLSCPGGADLMPKNRQYGYTVRCRPHVKRKMYVTLSESELSLDTLLLLSVFIYDLTTKGNASARQKASKANV